MKKPRNRHATKRGAKHVAKPAGTKLARKASEYRIAKQWA
jgi:hypothetical protein